MSDVLTLKDMQAVYEEMRRAHEPPGVIILREDSIWVQKYANADRTEVQVGDVRYPLMIQHER